MAPTTKFSGRDKKCALVGDHNVVAADTNATHSFDHDLCRPALNNGWFMEVKNTREFTSFKRIIVFINLAKMFFQFLERCIQNGRYIIPNISFDLIILVY